MISNNYIPEKINDANIYLAGDKMIGTTAELELPEVKMKTGTVEGMGISGEIDSPTIGQFESMEQTINFNTLYSSAMDMLSPLKTVELTIRAAQQVYDKVERGRVKNFKPGKVKKSETMDASITIELTYILIEVDGSVMLEIDKLNGVYKTNDTDMLAEVRGMT